MFDQHESTMCDPEEEGLCEEDSRVFQAKPAQICPKCPSENYFFKCDKRQLFLESRRNTCKDQLKVHRLFNDWIKQNDGQQGKKYGN